MASIENVVKVSITRSTQQVPLEAFNVPCVFGPSNRFTPDLIRYYESASAMITDGFELSDPEYIHVAEIFDQPNPPTSVGVSKYTAPSIQVDTFAVGTVTSAHVYSFMMGAALISYTAGGSETQQSILTALLASINAAFPTNNPVTGAVAGTGSGALLTLTSIAAGAGITYNTIDSLLTHTAVTPNHSIVSDIQATQAVDNTWYGVLVCSKATSDILQVAAYIQSQQKIYVTASSDANILTNSTTDVASKLMAGLYTRTSILYSANPNAAPDAAWMGVMLPVLPGAGNWKFKNLSGIDADNLSDTQITNANGKNCNVYTTVGGVEITSPGICASGDYIDVIIFIDWLTANIEVNVYQILVDAQKIPFTAAGIVAIENPVRQTLQIAEQNGGLAPGWTVTVPNIANVSSNDKATRTLNGVSFNATLAGAINKVNIQGYVGV